MRTIEKDYDYEIRKSRRKTISIMIDYPKVIIKAPLRASVHNIQRILNNYDKWIHDKLNQYNHDYKKFQSLIEYKQVLLYGNFINIKYNNAVSPKFKDNILYLPLNYNQKDLVNYYIMLAGEILYKKLVIIADKIKLPFNSFKISKARGKWGSCNSDKKIMLNYRLIMLSCDCIDYVIIHELCHTIEMNHSNKFWDLVYKFCPNYKNINKKLKDFKIINKIY